jgi:uncharacterized membrane protein YvbJ
MYCRNCGFELKEDAEFCGKCGNKVEKSAEKPNVPSFSPNKSGGKESVNTSGIMLAVSIVICVVLLLSPFMNLLSSKYVRVIRYTDSNGVHFEEDKEYSYKIKYQKYKDTSCIELFKQSGYRIEQFVNELNERGHTRGDIAVKTVFVFAISALFLIIMLLCLINIIALIIAFQSKPVNKNEKVWKNTGRFSKNMKPWVCSTRS